MGSDCRDVGAAPRHCTTGPAKRGGQARSAHGVGGGACHVLLSERSPVRSGDPDFVDHVGGLAGTDRQAVALGGACGCGLAVTGGRVVPVRLLAWGGRRAGNTVHVVDSVDWDRALLFGNDATPWLQQRSSDPSAVHWWDTAASLIYVTHFLLVWIIAAVLYLRDRCEWFLWGSALVVLSYAALVTFVIFPSAPPWYAGGQGVIAPVARIATRGLDPIGLHAAAQLVNQGTAAANDVAAIPSLHTAFVVLVAAWFWPRVPARYRWWLRPILFAYPVLMLATLVYTGEHYIVDGLIGALYVAAVLIGRRAWDTWRSRRAPTAELEAAAHRPPAPLGSPVSGAAPIALGSRASAHATPTAQPSADSLSRVRPQEQT